MGTNSVAITSTRESPAASWPSSWAASAFPAAKSEAVTRPTTEATRFPDPLLPMSLNWSRAGPPMLYATCAIAVLLSLPGAQSTTSRVLLFMSPSWFRTEPSTLNRTCARAASLTSCQMHVQQRRDCQERPIEEERMHLDALRWGQPLIRQQRLQGRLAQLGALLAKRSPIRQDMPYSSRHALLVKTYMGAHEWGAEQPATRQPRRRGKPTQPRATAGRRSSALARPSPAAWDMTSVAAQALPDARKDAAIVDQAAAFTTCSYETSPNYKDLILAPVI